MFTYPSRARNVWYGAMLAWTLPSGRGDSPVAKNRAPWRESNDTMLPSIVASTNCPSPFDSRACSATRIPIAAYNPATMSATGTPTMVGTPSGWPVSPCIPLMPWTMRS